MMSLSARFITDGRSSSRVHINVKFGTRDRTAVTHSNTHNFIHLLKMQHKGRSPVIDSLPARVDHASQPRIRLGPAALLDFSHRAIISRNVETPSVT